MTDIRNYDYMKMSSNFDSTWFCWIDGSEDGTTFSIRIQSAVALVEFDHRPGIVQANVELGRFYIHTAFRFPEGNYCGADITRRSTGAGHLLERVR